MEVLLKTIKDDTLEFPFVMAEIHTLPLMFDAIVHENEWQKVWKSNAGKWSIMKEGGDCGKSS